MAQRFLVRTLAAPAVAFVAVAVTLAGEARQVPPSAPGGQRQGLVQVEVLQGLMPDVEGWTRGAPRGSVVEISAGSSYSLAVADYAQGAVTVRLTFSDTLRREDCLIAVAPMVVILPEGYSESPSPARSISRFVFNGFQAASEWDTEKLAGEFSVVVNGRFVVKAEGKGLDALDTLRTVVSRVDLKKLASLDAPK